MVYSKDIESVVSRWPAIQKRMIQFLDEVSELPFHEIGGEFGHIEHISPDDRDGIFTTLLGFIASNKEVNPKWLLFGEGLPKNDHSVIAQYLDYLKGELKELEKAIKDNPNMVTIIDANGVPVLTAKLEPLGPLPYFGTLSDN